MLKVINKATGAIVAQYIIERPYQHPHESPYWAGWAEHTKKDRLERYEADSNALRLRNEARQHSAAILSNKLGDPYLILDTGFYDCLGDLNVEVSHG